MKIRLLSKFPEIPPVKAGVIILVLMLAFVIVPAYGQGSAQMLTQDQLQELVSPIALYPDELLANILAASTAPQDIVNAEKYLKSKGGKVTHMPDTDWDPSVKALLTFPDVLGFLNDNLSWTQTLGSAVINQQSDVMGAVQSFRKKTYDAGNLTTTPQQTVKTTGGVIEITPTNPSVIYVPQYVPETVVVQQSPDYLAPLIGFGVGLAVGDWFGCREVNWYSNSIFVNPGYFPHYNYRPGHNPYMPRPGYNGPYPWHPGPGPGPHPPGPPPNPVLRPTKPPVAYSHKPGTKPPGYAPKPGTRPPGYTPKPGTRPPGYTPKPGIKPSGNAPAPGMRPSGIAPKPQTMQAGTGRIPGYSAPVLRPVTQPPSSYSQRPFSQGGPQFGGQKGPSPGFSGNFNAFGNVQNRSSAISSSNRGSFSRSGGFGGGRSGGGSRGRRR